MSVLTQETRDRIRALFERYPDKQAVTLPALHMVQDQIRHVPAKAIEEIAELLELSPAQVHDTMTFYGFFRTERNPLGKHRVWICRSLPCMLRGGEQLLDKVSSRLGIKPGQTTPDGKVTLEFAECLGGCDGAPCLLVDDECHLNVSMEQVEAVLKEMG